jgi:hypothetical protein
MAEDKPKRAVLLFADDWEGLFIDGALLSQGHHLGEGSPERFWLDIGCNYGLNGDDLKVKGVSPEDEKELHKRGDFPKTLGELNGNYL